MDLNLIQAVIALHSKPMKHHYNLYWWSDRRGPWIRLNTCQDTQIKSRKHTQLIINAAVYLTLSTATTNGNINGKQWSKATLDV